MAPGVEGLPAAERDVDISGPIAELLAALPARTLVRIRLALHAIEWLPFPWRFSRLEPEAAGEFLQRMEGSRLDLHHQLLLMAKVVSTLGYAVNPQVQARVASRPSCALRDGSLPQPAAALGQLSERGDAECDVAVLGSGAGGAVAAAELAEAGLDVIVVEAGEHFDRGNYPSEPLAALAALYRDGGLTFAEGRPAIPVPVGRALGGTTVINSGTCFRAPEAVLERWRTRFGISWVGALDSDYAEAEDFLRVRRLDPERMGRNGQLTMEGAQAIGAAGAPISRNAGGCVQCSSCPFGCRIDAKRGMHVSYLPRAVAAGARIRTGTEARRILVEQGRAIGLRCLAGSRDPANGAREMLTIRARHAIVVAGGALGTPELLLRSGLGGPSVGRNLHIHPACWVGARFEEEVHGWDGVMQSYYVDQWASQGILLEATFTPLPFGGGWLPGAGAQHQRAMLDFGHIASIGVHLSDRSAGRVGLTRRGGLKMSYRLNDEEARRLTFGIARAAEIHFAAGASLVYPNIARIPSLPPGQLANFEATVFKPSELRLEAFHPMGTARIAANPGEGVCAVDGSVNGTQGLYVADASLFPSSVGVNPMMTVIAFAKQVAKAIAAQDAR